MRRIGWRNWAALVAFAAFAATFALMATGRTQPLDEAFRNLQHRHRLLADAGPMCRELAEGRFAAGDPLESLVAAFPPDDITSGPTYTQVVYRPRQKYDGIVVFAKHGRLAWMILGNHGDNIYSRFDTFEEGEDLVCHAEIDAARDARFKVRMAAAGPAATIVP